MEEKLPVVDECEGCIRVAEGYCSVYLYPKAKWRLGKCNMATHTKIEEEQKNKIRVGQQKQKKKGRR